MHVYIEKNNLITEGFKFTKILNMPLEIRYRLICVCVRTYFFNRGL